MTQPIYVTGFQLTGGGMEIMYFESREQSRNAGISRSLILSDTVDEYNKIIDSVSEDLIELIEMALQDIRSPSKSLNPRQRIAEQQAEQAEDVVDD